MLSNEPRQVSGNGNFIGGDSQDGSTRVVHNFANQKLGFLLKNNPSEQSKRMC